VFSLCEHHLLPFWCDVSIGYVARDKVLGLSKFARVAHQFAHRLQVQERLTHQVADEVERLAGSGDVAVLARGNHLCMAMRGIRSPATMTTSVMRGVFRETPSAREEFLRLATALGFP
jgi:GTP cyclohydrolase IA